MGDHEESVRRSARVLAGFMPHEAAVAFAATHVLEPKAFDAARSRVLERRRETGRAYVPPRVEAVPASAHAHLEEFGRRSRGRYSLADFQSVEIGRLIPIQYWVDADTALAGRGEAPPSEEEILRRCLPLDTVPNDKIVWTQSQNAVTACSMNTSLRFFPPQVDLTSGRVVFPVAHEPNVLVVRECEGRYVLANGNHRAFWLRSRGVTMAPALVVHPASRDLAAQGSAVARDVIFGDAPPCVDDWLDDERSVSVDIRSVLRVVRITAEVLTIPRLL
jgi:hypothetical protein